MKELTEYGNGFLDALIDGEGSLTLIKEPSKTTYRGWVLSIHVKVTNTSKGLLDKVQTILGTQKNYYIRKPGDHRNLTYTLDYRHTVARWLLPQLSFAIPEKERRRVLALRILGVLAEDVHGRVGVKNSPEREKRIADLCDEWKEKIEGARAGNQVKDVGNKEVSLVEMM